MSVTNTKVIGTPPAPVACDSRSIFAAPDDDAPVYRTCDNCERTYRRELTAHFEDSRSGETTACWACLGYDGIDEQVLECVEVVEHPGEMGPFYCPAGCAATGPDDHEDYCEAFCRTHRCELDPDAGCGYCVLDDAADEAGIGRRSPLMRWSPGTVR